MKKTVLLSLAILLSSVSFAQIPLDVYKVFNITQNGDTIEEKSNIIDEVVIKSRRGNVKLSLRVVEPEIELNKTMAKMKLFVNSTERHGDWDIEKFCETKKGTKVEIRHDWLHGYIKMDMDKDGELDHIILLKVNDGKPLETYIF